MAGATTSSPISTKILAIFVRSDNPASAVSGIRITLPSVAGWFLIGSGAVLQLFCYRAMGRLFICELCIRKEHKLVTYSVVRHPGYTAIVIAVVGHFLCYLGSGSWISECAGLLSVAQVLVLRSVMNWTFTTLVL